MKQSFTFLELVILVLVLLFLAAALLVLPKPAREKARRVNCAGNQKSIALATLMYSGDNQGYFPATAPGPSWFPLGDEDYIINEAPVWACPSARDRRTFDTDSNYWYVGSGKMDNDANAKVVSLGFDAFGNHPKNAWMNTSFIDGHVEGAKPGTKPRVGTNVGCPLK